MVDLEGLFKCLTDHQVELFGIECAVLALEGLIAAKRAAGRPKDLLVLPELEALWEANEGPTG